MRQDTQLQNNLVCSGRTRCPLWSWVIRHLLALSLTYNPVSTASDPWTMSSQQSQTRVSRAERLYIVECWMYALAACVCIIGCLVQAACVFVNGYIFLFLSACLWTCVHMDACVYACLCVWLCVCLCCCVLSEFLICMLMLVISCHQWSHVAVCV